MSNGQQHAKREEAPLLPLHFLDEDEQERASAALNRFLARIWEARQSELVERVKAILRRVELSARQQAAHPDERIEAGALVIDVARRHVTIDGQPLDLTAREFDLLRHFVRHPGRVFRRAQLLDSVWGYGHDGYEHTVNSHINRLRSKIEPDPAHPAYIVTVWGVGYKLEPGTAVTNA